MEEAVAEPALEEAVVQEAVKEATEEEVPAIKEAGVEYMAQ